MEGFRKSCRLCLTETDFCVSLHSNYCRKTNMIDKILVCLKIVIEETDFPNTICYKCAHKIENYYEFIAFIKKSQTKLENSDKYCAPKRGLNTEDSPTNHVNRGHVYFHEQVFDANYTFSFLEIPNEESKEVQASPFFSYFSPPNVAMKQSKVDDRKTPSPLEHDKKKPSCENLEYKRPCKSTNRRRHRSRDLFESQSQDVDADVDAAEPKSLNWKLTPGSNILKRIREKCFGQSDL